VLRFNLYSIVQVIVGPDTESAVTYCIQGSGLGALRHNTVVLGWPHRWRTKGSAGLLLQAMSLCKTAKLALIVPKYASTLRLSGPVPDTSLFETSDVVVNKC
jgi:hypothetical protein